MREVSSDIHAIDVIQSIQTTRSPLMIVLLIDDHGKERLGKIFVINRIIYHAEFENLQGNEALKRMIALPVKRVYIMKNEKTYPARTMDVEVDEALLAATFQRDDLKDGLMTRFIYPNRLVEEVRKVQDVVGLFFIVFRENSEVVDIEYLSGDYKSKKVEIAEIALSIVRELKKLNLEYDNIVLERNGMCYFVKPYISNQMVVIGKKDMPIDVLKLILDKTR